MTEYEDVLRKLEAMIEQLENLSLQQQAADPKRQKIVETAIGEARDLFAEIVRWQRTQENESQLAAVLEAIDRNTATTNDLLTVSEARLMQIEGELASRNGGAFEADPEVLDEGEFLKAQLAGVVGTEGPGPLFKDAVVVQVPTGLEVLSAAVIYTGATTVP